MRPRLVIAIDGPSGAGKSTVARAVAQRLGYSYIETGAMYRAVALLALESSTDLDDGPALGRLAGTADIRFVPGEGHDAPQKVILNGRDVSEKLRAPEVTRAASVVSTKSQVRQRLVELQRALGKEGGVVMEGRDIGTKVFPDAEVKIFLDAAPEVRAERRLRDTESSGRPLEGVLREITERDERDTTRELSPLVAAPDAVRIDSTMLSVEEVLEKIIALARERQSAQPEAR